MCEIVMMAEKVEAAMGLEPLPAPVAPEQFAATKPATAMN
jgi:hypothetical protein